MIKILLFAKAKELIGAAEVAIDLRPPQSIAQVREQLVAQHAELEQLLPSCRWAVDHSFVDDECQVLDGQEVALVPPVSGG